MEIKDHVAVLRRARELVRGLGEVCDYPWYGEPCERFLVLWNNASGWIWYSLDELESQFIKLD